MAHEAGIISNFWYSLMQRTKGMALLDLQLMHQVMSKFPGVMHRTNLYLLEAIGILGLIWKK